MKRRVRIIAAAVGILLLGAGTTAVAVLARGERHHARLSDFQQIPGMGDEGWIKVHDQDAAPQREGETGEDLQRRMVANWVQYGRPGAEARARIMEIARREAQRWSPLLPVARSAVLPPPGDYGEQWISIGPTDAAFEFNADVYYAVDSGRLSGIAAAPANLSTVYVSTSGGGVWRATNFGPSGTTWVPIAESIGNQAIGAMAMDPTNAAVLYIGTGDAFDREGGQVLKTVNATASPPTWSAAVALLGTDPSSGTSRGAKSIRDIRVDPTNANHVLVASDIGLFRSTDGGAHFTLVDLPNGGSLLMEATWSIAYLGQSGSTRWAVTGVRACQPGLLPPTAGLGVSAGSEIPLSNPPVMCSGGNSGDVWISSDGGATWTSRSAGGGLPQTVGRITLATGTPAADPAQTVVYAVAGTEDEVYGGYQIALWRSTTGATTFVDASGTTSNGAPDCVTPFVGDMQGWYNQALAVDPRDNNHVLIGGMFCGARTINGLSSYPSWDNVAHWLPSSGLGDTTAGPLPYVHADWHRALIVQTATGVRVLVGTDGGLSYADDLFTASPPTSVTWHGVNRGLPTHLSYGLASGDPATGNGALVMTGMQDNGTRLRATFAAGTTYDQVVGGDGTGTAVSRDNLGNLALYSGATGGRVVCNNALNATDCDNGTAWSDYSVNMAACSYEGDPFIMKYAEAAGDPRGPVLTFSDRAIFKSGGPQSPAFTAIGSCLASTERQHLLRNVAAAWGQDGVYGAALSGGRTAVTSNCQGTTTSCTWAISSRLGVDLNSSGTLETSERILNTSDVAFPPGATGAAAGDIYVATSSASETEAGTPIPDTIGHIFLTNDRGTTWTPLHGNGTSDLPNVPIEVVRYDPTDAANNTILAGTMIGVYRTTDRGLTWTRYGSGLPFVQVNDLFISRSGGLIRISTYGRGIWEINPGAVTRALAGSGDYDRDGRIGFFDLAAMAGRLGKTPAASTWPLYDWNLNMAGSTAALDDADLSALVSRFGGQP